MTASVLPMHRGHHPVWEDGVYHVDICNMVDDVVIGDLLSEGVFYRFPINGHLLPWLEMLLEAMNEYDHASGNSWSDYNAAVRMRLMDVAVRRLDGNPPRLNIFEPGAVTPAKGDSVAVDQILTHMITARKPKALVD